MLLSRPVIRMPALADGEWLNSPPLTRESLRGRVVLVDFWEFSCVNCVRTLPYLAEWHRKYEPLGLTVVGIHTPEFKFGQQRPQIEAALDEFNIAYPVLLDNRQENWDRFANKAWPTKYLIDASGYIRYQRRGEGGYRDTERGIQQLLADRNPAVDLPPLSPMLREEDEAGAVCFPVTPELHAGFAGGLFGGALGNPEGYLPHEAVVYDLPEERQAGALYLQGIWQATREGLRFVGQGSGRVAIPYSAAGVNAVLSPSGDEVELLLGIMPGGERPLVEVRLDGRPLDRQIAGGDIFYDDQGRSLVQVTRPRMAHLVNHPTLHQGELELIFLNHGLTLYTITFTSCRKS